jgi:hypothetical protein
LKKEIEAQEFLLLGYQKENEKLVAILREKEKEEAYRTAKHFDQQEKMNKELNRLRNALGGKSVNDAGSNSDGIKEKLISSAFIGTSAEETQDIKAPVGTGIGSVLFY